MVDIEKWTEIAWAEQANGRDLLIPTEVFFELIADLESATAERARLRAEVERRARNEIRLGDLYSTTEKHLIASGIENDRLREEVEALRAVVDLLSMLRGMINCTPENDELKSGAWISTKHPTIQRIDALLAAMTAKEEV